MIHLNVNCKTFFFANLNSDFHKNGLFLRAISILKKTHHKIHFSFEGYPCVKMYNVFTLKALSISFKIVVLSGRVKCSGTEGEIVVANGCRKRKKLICGPKEEIVVAHGRLPSPARQMRACTFSLVQCYAE